MSEEDGAMDIGNMYKKFGKDCACGSGDICIVNGEEKPSGQYAMRPIVNMSEEDRATDTGNKHKKFGKDCLCGSGDILADRQTYQHRDILITILCNHTRRRSSKHNNSTSGTQYL